MKRTLFLCFMLLSHLPLMTTPSQDIHSYMWANYNQFAGNFDKAQQWYNHLLQHQSSALFYKGYVPLLFETNRFNEILTLLPSLDKQFEQDSEMQQLLALSLQKVGHLQEADDKFIRLSNQFKSDQAIAFQTANIYMRRKEPENALLTIDNLLNSSPRKPNNFIFHFLKSQIFVQLNQHEKALESITACLAMQPHFDKGWLLMALLQEQLGRIGEAIKGFTSFLEITGGNNREIEQHLLQLIFKQKMSLAHNGIVMPQSCFAQALSFFEQKQYGTALVHVDKCLQENPLDPESRLLKIQIMTATGNQSQAAELLKGWIIQQPQEHMWYNTIHLLCRNGLQLQKAMNIFQEIAKAHPKELLPLLYVADVATRHEQPDTALLYHKKALEMADDARLKTKILYQMALLYHKQHNLAAMEQCLEQGLVLGQNFPPLLNLLAHHYAEHDTQLEKAEQLLTTALQTNENNPHFLDTKALIWYKQKKYDKALALLKNITQQVPQDFSILSTLGKTYYEVGNLTLARTTIEQASNVARNSHEKEQCITLLKQWSS